MNCPNCNQPVMPGQKFCNRCGTKLEPLTDNFDNPQQAPAPAPTQIYEPSPAGDAMPTQVYEPAPGEAPAFEQPVTYGDGYVEPLTQQPNFDVSEPEQPSYAQPPYRQAPQPSEYPPQPSEYPPYQPQQYQQKYQPQPPYAAQQSSKNGGKSNNSKTPLIIVIIVLAVLLVGGGIFTAIMLINNNGDGKDGSATSSTTGVSSSQSESSKTTSSKTESSKRESAEESSRVESSSQAESSSRVESSTYSSREESSSAITPSADANKLYNDNGILLADDPAIDANDATTEAILNLSMQQGGLDAQMETLNKQMGDKGSAAVFVKGNCIVMEFDVTDALSETEKASFGPALDATSGQMMQSFQTLKDQYGITVNVVVALVEESGNVYYSKVYTP